MDTKGVDLRWNVFVNKNLNGVTSWDQDINIAFIPDEVIIRNVRYSCGNAENGVSIISSNLVSEITLCSFINPQSTSPNTIFTLKKPILGKCNFTLSNVTPNGLNPARIGDLSIQLEFVKYARAK